MISHEAIQSTTIAYVPSDALEQRCVFCEGNVARADLYALLFDANGVFRGPVCDRCQGHIAEAERNVGVMTRRLWAGYGGPEAA